MISIKEYYQSKQQKPARPERVIQFGEGGFLRGFVDWMIQKMNDAGAFDGSIVVVQPIEKGMCDLLTEQDCLYTHLIRGKDGVEQTLVDSISRCVKPYEDFEGFLRLAEQPEMRFIVSNTTEAGIVFDPADQPTDTPPASFPAKLTLLLKRRFEKGLGGFVLLPCELIDRNGDNLKKCVLKYAEAWGLSAEFVAWVETENVFTNTLVDRINTGYPRGEAIDLPYEDKMLNTSEYYHLWVIETAHALAAELPFDKAGLNVILTRDALERYRTRKVRILNGAHTSLVPYALLSGFDTVRSCVEDEGMNAFLRKCIFEEIIPTLDLSEEELTQYASDVLTRFANPYINHYLSSIALNSISKFKTRVLPSILEYKKRFGTYPETLLFAFAKLLDFYKTDMTNDDAALTEYFKTHSVKEILARSDVFGEDLSPMAEEVARLANS